MSQHKRQYSQIQRGRSLYSPRARPITGSLQTRYQPMHTIDMQLRRVQRGRSLYTAGARPITGSLQARSHLMHKRKISAQQDPKKKKLMLPKHSTGSMQIHPHQMYHKPFPLCVYELYRSGYTADTQGEKGYLSRFSNALHEVYSQMRYGQTHRGKLAIIQSKILLRRNQIQSANQPANE